jgi:hypothetical protein
MSAPTSSGHLGDGDGGSGPWQAERKRLQIKNAPNLTPRAKILKFADKFSNLRSLATSPPADWPLQRRIDYVIWTREVVQGLRGASILLEQEFDRAAADAERTIPLAEKAAVRRNAGCPA